MRTKTLLLTAALVAAGVATSMAQAPVYSANVVGFVNVVMQPGFNLIANPLNAATNTLQALIPTAPVQSQFFKYTTGSGYSVYDFDEFENRWTPNGDVTIAPGEGGFFRNASTAPFTVTFVGEVMQGTLTQTLPQGFSIRSSMVPQTADVNTLGVPALPNDRLFKYTNGAGYSVYQFDEFENRWTPDVPVINVGEAFFIEKTQGQTWTRNFTVQ